MNHKEEPKLFIRGHVIINDVTDVLDKPEYDAHGAISNGRKVRDDHNAIHSENMSVALANSMAGVLGSDGKISGAIAQMRFGNGGTVILANSRVTYKKPRVTSYGGLYAQTYAKSINGNLDSTVDTSLNYVTQYHIDGQIFSDIICVCTLGLGEPSDQSASSTTELSSTYAFDEIALYSQAGNPLTHIVFYPVEKTANKVLQIKYTIRIQLS